MQAPRSMQLSAPWQSNLPCFVLYSHPANRTTRTPNPLAGAFYRALGGAITLVRLFIAMLVDKRPFTTYATRAAFTTSSLPEEGYPNRRGVISFAHEQDDTPKRCRTVPTWFRFLRARARRPSLFDRYSTILWLPLGGRRLDRGGRRLDRGGRNDATSIREHKRSPVNFRQTETATTHARARMLKLTQRGDVGYFK